MKDICITKYEANLLKPYLRYMDFGSVTDSHKRNLIERTMYDNMRLGNVIKKTLLQDLSKNFKLHNPEVEIPDILKGKN